MAFRKAEKKKAKLRLAITGTAGSGKTYGALLVAQGLGGRIAMIDTENGSGDLYSDICDYDICTLSAPYRIEKYLQCIHEAEQAGYDIIIIDSLSHAWAGEGGLLDLQGQIADSQKSGNQWTSWRKITPLHNKLVEAILTSKSHIIATMRSKAEYVLVEGERGRNEVKKVGMAPVQRDGMDYEFSVVFDLSINHAVSVSKDRTSVFDGQIFTLSPDVGLQLREWLDKGVEDLTQAKQAVWQKFLNLNNNNQQEAMTSMKLLVGDKSSAMWTAEDIAIMNAVADEKIASLVQEQNQKQNSEPDSSEID